MDADPRYLKAHLTSSEIRYCKAKKYPAEPAAARIASKKALLQILKVPASRQMQWMREIQIGKKPDGKPFIKLSALFKKNFKVKADSRWLLSIAHERELAVAWVSVCGA
ncbi:MAG TPA: hypothetical protein PLY88_08265 [Candidatus Omnitrophota bacterium]|nr:hypothetical protein [Candidatus Omnitrophota bacterium]